MLARELGQIEDSSSIHSATGTVAHGVLEAMLRDEPLPAAGTVVSQDGFDVTVTNEMIELVRGVYERVRQKAAGGPVLEAEHKVEIGSMFGLPEGLCAGTSDIVAIDAAGVLQVGDLKYGMSPVSPDSMQLQLYAAGALYRLLLLYDIEFVELTIYQPRLGAEPTSLMRRSDLMRSVGGYFNQVRLSQRIGESIAGVRTMKEAFEMTAEHQRADVKGCWWCPVKAGCPTHRQGIVRRIEETVGGVEIHATPESMAETLEWADAAERWAKVVKEAARQAALKGVELPGWGLSERRSARAWKDEQEAAQALTGVVDKDVLYTEPSLRTPTQLEKAGVPAEQIEPLLAERTVSVSLKRGKGEKPPGFRGWQEMQADRLADMGFSPV